MSDQMSRPDYFRTFKAMLRFFLNNATAFALFFAAACILAVYDKPNMQIAGTLIGVGIAWMICFRRSNESTTESIGEIDHPDDLVGAVGFPFDSPEARRRQDAAARALELPVELPVEFPNGVKMDFMLIPAGEFMMGSPEDEHEGERGHDEHLHRVRITKPFYMAKHKCTQEQWQAITGENPSHFKDKPRNPVERVSWNDINDTFLPAIQNRNMPPKV